MPASDKTQEDEAPLPVEIPPEPTDDSPGGHEEESVEVAIPEDPAIRSPNQPSAPPPTIDQLNENEEEDEKIDFTPFIEKLAPSTRKILEDDYHAKFIHLIKPKNPKKT